MIVDYILIRQYMCGDLTDDVRKKLKEGWELYGTPIHAESYFHQAMVKYDTKTNQTMEKWKLAKNKASIST